MKKLYTFLLAAVVSFTANGQLTNGNLEAWSTNNTPEAFSAATTGISKESTIKHGGEFSAKHQTPTLPGDGDQGATRSDWLLLAQQNFDSKCVLMLTVTLVAV